MHQFAVLMDIEEVIMLVAS